jgi:hypothetical protein
MNQSRHIRTEADIVAAFRAVYSTGKRYGDGKSDMARWLGVSHQAVCNWFMKPANGGQPMGIPNGYQGRLMLWARRHGFILHPETFGLETDGSPMNLPRTNADAA